MARILITNFHPIGGGGHVPYIEALTRIQLYSDHIIGIATPRTSRLYQYLNDINYPRLFACDFPAKIQKEPFSILKNLRQFIKIVSDFKPDIIHTNGVDLFIVNFTSFFTLNYKIIRTHHAIKKIPIDPYHKWLYNKRISSNIYVSNTAREISTQDGLKTANTCIIENGVDLSKYYPQSKDTNLAKQLGIDQDTFCFGSIAGTAPYKRVDTIIEAAKKLKETTNKKFKILVLGDELSGQLLQNIAIENGVNEFVFCGFHKDTQKYISLFDVGFVLSDSIETISFAAREMMSMAKPLISSSFSGLKENIVHGHNGLLIEPNNISQLLDAMEFFMDLDLDSLSKFSSRSRQYAEDNFDIRNQVKSHINLYETLLKNTP